MFHPLKPKSQQPFLSPLGQCRRPLPAVAAPLAVTIIGGVALVVAFGGLFSGVVNKTSTPASAAYSTNELEVIQEARQVATLTGDPGDQDSGSEDAVSALDHFATGSAVANKLEPAAPSANASASIRTGAIPQATLPEMAGGSEPQILSFNAPASADQAGEIAILEVIPLQPLAAEEADPEAAAVEESQPTVTAQAPSNPGMKPAIVSSAVNLRSSPDNDARVLTVVPAKAEIEAETDCRWCAVTYGGSQGFIYKSFINYR